MQQKIDKGQILIVEDENIVALDIRQSLNRLGYSVPGVAATGEEAVAAAHRLQPDLILMDIRLRGQMDGIEAATQIRQQQHLPIIYLTAFADTQTLDRAKLTEPFGYILKPFEDRELNSTIEMALYRHQMEQRLQESEHWLDTTLRSIGDAVIATDSVGRINFMNPMAIKLTGCQPDAVQGQLFDHVMQIYVRSAGGMQPIHVVQPQSDIKNVRTCEDGMLVLPNKATLPIDCTIAPLLSEERLVGSVVVLRDISRRKSAETALRASEQRYRSLFEQAQTALLTSELHNQINRSLMSSVHMDDVLQAIVDGVAQVISAGYVFLHLIDQEAGRIYPVVRNHSKKGAWAEGEIDLDQHWPQFVGMVIEEKRPVYLHRTDQAGGDTPVGRLADSHFGTPAWNPFTEHPDGDRFSAVVSVPLIYRGKVLGALTAINQMTDPPLTERELELILVIANQATVAIENARLFAEAEQKAVALSRSNAELEQFAYIASHDMQEPLRMIQGYSQLLTSRCAGQNADTDDFLGFISDGVEQLNTLISDLLSYCHMGFQIDVHSVVSTEQILDRTLAGLLSTIQDTQAVITHDPLPELAVDATQFGQLLQNLISNAMKYRATEPPRVHIQAKWVDNCWQFSVSDNGIGIKQEFQDQIFVAFRRLHSRVEYAGTGIGLAICKKIVDAHHGKIWCESKPGKGSIFFFTICTGSKTPIGDANTPHKFIRTKLVSNDISH